MAKLEIKLNEDAKKKIQERDYHAITIRDYDISIDGHEPTLITDVALELSATKFNQATISFAVDELDVDAEFLTTLKMKMEEKERKEGIK
jgi:hypothetical protein